MDIIKLLDNLEVGIPLVVTTTWQDLVNREVTLYGGKNDEGIYNFITIDTTFGMTPRYIKEHCTISQELDQDTDLYEVVKICNKVKGVK